MLRRAISCSLSLELEVPGEVRAVRTDERQLEVLLTELVENAVKYTPAGGSVRLGITDGQEGVRLTVRDTGPGFRPEEIPHLFEPFFRGKSADESQVKGSGLGLAIAARLAELLGGQLSAANGAGGGAQLEFYLPRGGNGQSSVVDTFEKPRS
jgi:signal transduction histidine kinase